MNVDLSPAQIFSTRAVILGAFLVMNLRAIFVFRSLMVIVFSLSAFPASAERGRCISVFVPAWLQNK